LFICYKFDFAKLRIILQLKTENPIKQQLTSFKKPPRIIPQCLKMNPYCSQINILTILL